MSAPDFHPVLVPNPGTLQQLFAIATSLDRVVVLAAREDFYIVAVGAMTERTSRLRQGADDLVGRLECRIADVPALADRWDQVTPQTLRATMTTKGCPTRWAGAAIAVAAALQRDGVTLTYRPARTPSWESRRLQPDFREIDASHFSFDQAVRWLTDPSAVRA